VTKHSDWYSSGIGAGTIFRLGMHKLAKNNQDNQIYNITLCNMYFSKKVYAVYNGVRDKASRSWGVLEHFCVNNNLTVCNVTVRKKMGEQDVLLAPQI